MIDRQPRLAPPTNRCWLTDEHLRLFRATPFIKPTTSPKSHSWDFASYYKMDGQCFLYRGLAGRRGGLCGGSGKMEEGEWSAASNLALICRRV